MSYASWAARNLARVAAVCGCLDFVSTRATIVRCAVFTFGVEHCSALGLSAAKVLRRRQSAQLLFASRADSPWGFFEEIIAHEPFARRAPRTRRDDQPVKITLPGPCRGRPTIRKPCPGAVARARASDRARARFVSPRRLFRMRSSVGRFGYPAQSQAAASSALAFDASFGSLHWAACSAKSAVVRSRRPRTSGVLGRARRRRHLSTSPRSSSPAPRRACASPASPTGAVKVSAWRPRPRFRRLKRLRRLRWRRALVGRAPPRGVSLHFFRTGSTTQFTRNRT